MPLRLHDVDDAFAFAGAIANRSLPELGHDDREDLRQFLVVELWKLSLRFDGSQGSRFSAWAKLTLQRRCFDWKRQRYGRTKWKWKDHVYERERPIFVSLNTGLVETLGSGSGDPADSGDLGLAGVLGTGDRQRSRDFETLGL